MGRDPNIGCENSKNGSRKVIQIRRNDFLQNQKFKDLQNFFSFRLLSLSKLLHHTHLVGFISIKQDYCIISCFLKVLAANQLLQNVPKLFFIIVE